MHFVERAGGAGSDGVTVARRACRMDVSCFVLLLFVRSDSRWGATWLLMDRCMGERKILPAATLHSRGAALWDIYAGPPGRASPPGLPALHGNRRVMANNIKLNRQ